MLYSNDIITDDQIEPLSVDQWSLGKVPIEALSAMTGNFKKRKILVIVARGIRPRMLLSTYRINR
jgi:hypothetical protein